MRTLPLPQLAACLLALTQSMTNADWRNFRGPNGNGTAEGDQNPPTELSEESIAWSVELPGRGLGSPIIVGDKVFLTASGGPKQDQLHILCFNAANGSQVWHRRFWATGRTMSHKKTCVAAPTPASDGKRIYALYSSNDLICLNLEGNLIWLRGLTLDYPNASNSLGMASSPIVVGDTLVAQIENDSESFAAGFDLDTGANKWKMDRPKASNWTSPVAIETGEQLVVALQSSKGILGVMPSTGSKIFEYGKGASTVPSSAVSDGRLYIPSNGLTAIEPVDDGDEPKQLWNESAQNPGTSSPVILGNKVYIVNKAGVVSCASRETGERLWRIRLEGGGQKGLSFSGSPVAASNGHLYVFSEEGVGLCIDVSGAEGKIVSTVALKETILGTPSISDDAIYVRSDGHLWKFAN